MPSNLPLRVPARRSLARLLAAALAVLVPACAEAPAPAAAAADERTAAPTGPAAAPEKAVRDLMTALTPLAPETPVGERNAWFQRRKDTLQRMRTAGPEVGRAALAAYEKRADARAGLRAGLLDVAAHGVPAETLPVLEGLITTYGDDLGLRSEACGLLARIAPERAVELFEPILGESRRAATYPPDDRMIDAWIAAAVQTGREQAPLLTKIAMDPYQSPEARQWAVKGLGDVPGARSRAALESLLTEPGGNHYLRRLAAQSLASTVEVDELCETIRNVIEQEGDVNFQLFLDNMLSQRCR